MELVVLEFCRCDSKFNRCENKSQCSLKNFIFIFAQFPRRDIQLYVYSKTTAKGVSRKISREGNGKNKTEK